jgi:aldehyde:ferredoxin oxidoreductase
VDFDHGLGTAKWYKDVVEGFKGMDPLSEEGKAAMLRWHENIRAFEHCLQVCMFTHPDSTEQPHSVMQARLYNGVTGVGIDEAEVSLIGERIVNLERAFNVREGLTRKDDSLPERFLKEPLPDGASKGQVVNLDFMLDEYYELRGWQRETGYPTKEKLEQLGLSQAAKVLKDMGRLAERSI